MASLGLNLLIEAYMREKGIQFYALGGFTISEPGYASGIPDDAYSFGSRKQVPDIVLEVIVTSGTIDKRELYKPIAHCAAEGARSVPAVASTGSLVLEIRPTQGLLFERGRV
ncbi:MAG: hypothetical protein GDA56_06545 [Hormoscilla sp. GM7CHS1pb]|nr:hypothetical protein [Hormoscilla sp. GM7CHS1pb]